VKGPPSRRDGCGNGDSMILKRLAILAVPALLVACGGGGDGGGGDEGLGDHGGAPLVVKVMTRPGHRWLQN